MNKSDTVTYSLRESNYLQLRSAILKGELLRRMRRKCKCEQRSARDYNNHVPCDACSAIGEFEALGYGNPAEEMRKYDEASKAIKAKLKAK